MVGYFNSISKYESYIISNRIKLVKVLNRVFKTYTHLYFFQGAAIGKCPKDKIFRGYIDLEIQLREFERCRILYEKFLGFSPENCTTWMKVKLNLLAK